MWRFWTITTSIPSGMLYDSLGVGCRVSGVGCRVLGVSHVIQVLGVECICFQMRFLSCVWIWCAFVYLFPWVSVMWSRCLFICFLLFCFLRCAPGSKLAELGQSPIWDVASVLIGTYLEPICFLMRFLSWAWKWCEFVYLFSWVSVMWSRCLFICFLGCQSCDIYICFLMRFFSCAWIWCQSCDPGVGCWVYMFSDAIS
jgi:hypothetical protein